MSKIPEIYGSMVFNEHTMQERLPSATFKELMKTIKNGAPLNLEVANVVAHAMKEWAIEQGATHYTHWFQPLSGITSEKHDSFLDPTGDGRAIMSFSGKELIQGEPDASSFPSGGLRAPFEARGYTAWDPTSYAFIKDEVLCIPTAFCSYTGEALDKKTPLLRSMSAIDEQAKRVLALFGDKPERVVTTVGAEQEYFLISEKDYAERTDLIMTGRTLFGYAPLKGQELEEHYFGAIRPSVNEFMKELDDELWKLGVSAKTKHNEVAPAQHELAPLFTNANRAIDENLLTMEKMRLMASHYGLVCLQHEKPFEGINGSGKHNNWSISAGKTNFLDPGETPMDNLRFLVFLTGVIQAVDDYQELLRMTVASAGNDHRLGANEAPPAIVSIFLGDELGAIVDALVDEHEYTSAEKVAMDLGVSVLPNFLKDNTDHNRTSPFAFTGNRFEFRAVGSSANCASAQIVLNTAVAEALADFKARVDQLIAKGEEKFAAILSVVRDDIKTCAPVHFDGNGYSDEWVEEAAKRGLDTEKSAPVIFDRYLDPETIKMFESTGVMKKNELEARNEVKWETYTKKIQIEARVLGDLSLNHIIPVATHYQSMIAKDVQNLMAIYGAEKGKKLSERIMNIIEQISERTAAIEKNVEDMVNARKVANKIQDEREKAIAYHDTVETFFDTIRYQIDKLELVVADELWTLPKYRELLFIR